MNLSNTDLADGAFVGGILGFIEEAIENERFGENNDTELTADDIREESLNDVNFRLLYNQNPSLAVYLVNKFIEHKKMAPINHKFKIIMTEIEEEIKQMKREKAHGNGK